MSVQGMREESDVSYLHTNQINITEIQCLHNTTPTYWLITLSQSVVILPGLIYDDYGILK